MCGTLFYFAHIMSNYISCVGCVVERPLCAVFNNPPIRHHEAFELYSRDRQFIVFNVVASVSRDSLVNWNASLLSSSHIYCTESVGGFYNIKCAAKSTEIKRVRVDKIRLKSLKRF